MSNPIKGIGKVIGGAADMVGDVLQGAGKVLKKAWPIIAIAAVAYFTGGFGVSTMAGGAGAGLTHAQATAVLTSQAAYTGGTAATAGTLGSLSGAAQAGEIPLAGLDPAIETSAAKFTSGMSASQAAQTVDYSVAESLASGASQQAARQNMAMAQQSVSQNAAASKMMQLSDELQSSLPFTKKGGYLSGVKTLFSKAGNFVEEHPYLSMMGFQTLQNMSQPSPLSPEEEYELKNRWPGAFFGMEHDGRTVEGYPQVTRYAPGTGPSPSLLGRAKAAARGEGGTVDPTQDNPLLRGKLRASITQMKRG